MYYKALTVVAGLEKMFPSQKASKISLSFMCIFVYKKGTVFLQIPNFSPPCVEAGQIAPRMNIFTVTVLFKFCSNKVVLLYLHTPN